MEENVNTNGLEEFCTWLVQHGEVARVDNALQLRVPEHPCVSKVFAAHLPMAERVGKGDWTCSGVSTLDFVCSVVEAAEFKHIFAGSKFERALWLACQNPPTAVATTELFINVQLIDESAVVPHKQRASDSGYDLTLIGERKRFGAVRLYGTGLIVEPPEGYYFDVVARSSIIKTGHMLANNVGIIDRAYRGELMVPVVKVDPAAADLELPIRLAQLIPRPIVHFQVNVQDNLAATSRGTGGFGSSG